MRGIVIWTFLLCYMARMVLERVCQRVREVRYGDGPCAEIPPLLMSVHSYLPSRPLHLVASLKSHLFLGVGCNCFSSGITQGARGYVPWLGAPDAAATSVTWAEPLCSHADDQGPPWSNVVSWRVSKIFTNTEGGMCSPAFRY